MVNGHCRGQEIAVDAETEITIPVEDIFWGDRYGQLEDPFDYHWSIAMLVRDMSPEEMQTAEQKQT
ncbi:MAG: hypothetical protein ACR65R_03310 [Methylomicrobium sp.]